MDAWRWKNSCGGLRVLLLCLGAVSLASGRARGQAPLPLDKAGAATASAKAPIVVSKNAVVTVQEQPAAPAEKQAPLVVEGPQPVDPATNPDGDIEFQRGILKFPNSPTAPRRNARADAGSPLGWAGRTPILPNDLPNGDFFPVDDRWRIPFPKWDRWIWGLPIDSYHQNVLKGDYPIWGTECIFFNITAVDDHFAELREATVKGGVQNQSQYFQTNFVTIDLFKGDNSFHPSEWTIQATPFFQMRDQSFNNTHEIVTLADAFVDYQLAILSDYYDQVNLRVGRQAFNADFRGFLFNDANDAIRVFGNAWENRIQYNVYAFWLAEKDPVTQQDEFFRRREEVYGANIFWQDPGSLWGTDRFLGLTLEANVLYNHDTSGQPVAGRALDCVYLELAADGRIGRLNVDAAFIQEFGHDTKNPITKNAQDVSAEMAELEVVYPIDWLFPKVSVLYASGDNKVNNKNATGFDAPFDNPNFAGAGFSYFQREAFNSNAQTKNQFTFYPSLRNKFVQASNNVNPGLFLLNTGFNANLTARAQLQMNFNYYQFVDSNPLEVANKLAGVSKDLGTEVNLGLVYKPLMIDNITFALGASAFFPGHAILDLNKSQDTLYTVFGDITLFY
jgi:hypothetical protein